MTGPARTAAVARLAGVVVAYALAFCGYWFAVPDGLTSPWFVMVSTICVLGLTFVIQPVVPLRLPPCLGHVRSWERQAYRSTGVAAFGALLRRTPLRILNTRVYLASGRQGRSHVAVMLESAEVSHLLSLASALPFMILIGTRSDWSVLAWFGTAQVLINVYPIAHLRLARSRLERAIARRPASHV